MLSNTAEPRPHLTWRAAFRTSTFRNAALASAVFAAGTVALFAFIYWQTAIYEADQIDRTVLHEAAIIAREKPQDLAGDLQARFAGDLHRLTFAAVFTGDRHLLIGGVAAFPADLPIDGRTHVVTAIQNTAAEPAAEQVTATARALPDGRIVLVGRSRRELQHLRLLVGRALALGLIPALGLALAAGTWASRRSLTRIAAFRTALDRIMDGDLQERLPTGGARDTIDILAVSVNRLLDQMERLLGEVRGVGDSIAHDLRTPLARMRARLEGGRRRAATRAELDDVAVQAIADLDQCFGTITALLRIGELDGTRRRSGFATVDLSAIAEEAADLYQPVAELRRIRFSVTAPPGIEVFGDRDLLFEVCANLLDNAMKFAPDGGTVSLAALRGERGPILRVADSGPGIAVAEQAAVMQRFYRSSNAAAVPGSGLGLSLVAAILRLHEFELFMEMRGGSFVVEMRCARAAD